MHEIIKCLTNGIKPGESYPPTFRSFCISLHYTSVKGYIFLRKKFNNNLPHPETIRQWYRNSDLDSTSGIGEKSMDILAKKAQQMSEKGQQLVVSLLMDEMAIKRFMAWCRHTNKFIGLIDCGTFDEDDEFSLASNVLVFMAVGVNAYFQQPVAYYFVQTIKADERAVILKNIITALTQRKIKVGCAIFDGHTTHAPMCEQLGAKFNEEDGNYITSFKNPVDGSNVYTQYDPSHLEKLVRNTLGNQQTIYHGEDKIEWKYFIALVNISKQSNFGLNHKMNKRHVNYKQRVMHVRTAIETLSRSTAESLEFLMKSGHPEFVNATETIKFTKIFDQLWDVFNTQRVKNDEHNIFKSAIYSSNVIEIFHFLDEAKEYILALKIKNSGGKLIPIVKSNWKTAFRGYIIDIISLKAMYFEFVEQRHWLNFFATYRFSQDHLEMFFGKIRSLNGHCDNPMAHQFVSAYRKLLHQSDILISSFSNVSALCSSNVLTVSSVTKRGRSILNNDLLQLSGEKTPEHPNTSEEIPNEYMDLDLLRSTSYLTDETHDSGILYTASLVERQLTTSNQIHCIDCLDVLTCSEKVDDNMCVTLKNNKPCMSTYLICKSTDNAIKIFINTGPQFKMRIYSEVLNKITWESTFPLCSVAKHDKDHKHFLVKFIIDEYINKKCAYIAKQKTLDLEKIYLRNKLRKMCHNLHQ